MPLKVVANSSNLGPGAAFDLGFWEILKDIKENDVIVTLEADNTSDLGILSEMLQCIENGADLFCAFNIIKNQHFFTTYDC